jgi:hypothetical protein
MPPWILTVWLVKGKAVEDSQDARQEVLLPAYRVTGNPEVIPGRKAASRKFHHISNDKRYDSIWE